MLLRSHLFFTLAVPLSFSVVSCTQNPKSNLNTKNGIQNAYSQQDSQMDNFANPKTGKKKKGERFCTDLMNAELNPIGRYEWHLYNYGNEAFATPFTAEQRQAAYGQDVNAYYVLKDYCLSGDGVHVAVLDTGLQTAHPSLAPNVDNRPYKSLTWSVNYRGNRLSPNDPSPIPEDDEDHGTMVAGIIAMRSNLGFGGSGVAPRASLAAYNIIQDDTQTFNNFYESLGASDAAKNNDIFSMSYGLNNTSQVSVDEPIELASISMYKTGTRLLRNGKGAIYVKASGNGFSGFGSMMDFMVCGNARKYGVSCQNSSMNPDNAMPEVITVGAVNVFGKKTSYSTTGASLWVVAPGGEYGFDKTWVDSEYKRFDGAAMDWSIYRATLGEPAVVSTDVMGPRAGISHTIDMDSLDEIFNIRNAFNAGLVPENADHNYTNSMNGTSSATPLTSGSIAVVLEANPTLTWRDVKYILAKTSTQVDPNFAGVTAELKNGPFQLEQGWVTNAAGFHFSNWYGFGRVNVQAAVDLARNYNVSLGTYVERAWWPQGKTLSLVLPAGDYAGAVRVVTVPKSQNLVIESVQIKVSVESGSLGDLAFELTSPSGTKSIVWHAGNGFDGDLNDMIMQSNAFYGESSVGEWTFRAINTGMHSKSATLTGFQLKVTGHEGGNS